jgi:hypothetical protein
VVLLRRLDLTIGDNCAVLTNPKIRVLLALRQFVFGEPLRRKVVSRQIGFDEV